MATRKSTSSDTRNTKSSNNYKKTNSKKNTSNTKNSKNTKNSQNSQNSKNSEKGRKNSGDTMKFLLVLVVAGIAITLLLLLQKNPEGASENPTGSPTEGVAGTPGIANTTVTPEATPTVTSVPSPTNSVTEGAQPTDMPNVVTNTPVPTTEPTKEPTSAPQETETPTPTATVKKIDAQEAQKKVEQAIGGEYGIQLINDHLHLGDSEFYLFCAVSGGQMLYPFLAVDASDGMVYGYDMSADAIYELGEFPEKQEQPSVTQAPENPGKLSAEEAYGVLCTYSKESLGIAKEVSAYNVEYDSELTLVNGTVNCYRFNLSEVTSDGRVRNRGVFFVSVEGTKCYYIDSDTNEFVLVRQQ